MVALDGTREQRRRQPVRRLVLNRAAGCAIEHPHNALEIEIGTIVADVVLSEEGEVVHGTEHMSTAGAAEPDATSSLSARAQWRTL